VRPALCWRQVVIAISDFGLAVIIGVATAIGAAVGGVIAALTTWRVEVSRQKREERRSQLEARAAARLVWLELENARSTFSESRAGTWTAANPPTDAWREHRGLLASVLNLSDWTDVANAVDAVGWERNRAEVGKPVEDLQGLEDSLGKVEKGKERLAPLVQKEPIASA
jgi:uncharacterized membrane protein YciS (DUF1049 family)